MRGGEEALGAPEGVVEVGAVGLELGGEAAVEHGGAADLAEEIEQQIAGGASAHAVASESEGGAKEGRIGWNRRGWGLFIGVEERRCMRPESRLSLSPAWINAGLMLDSRNSASSFRF